MKADEVVVGGQYRYRDKQNAFRGKPVILTVIGKRVDGFWRVSYLDPDDLGHRTSAIYSPEDFIPLELEWLT